MNQDAVQNEKSLHPIQLITLAVRELFIKSNLPPDSSVGAEAEKCNIITGSSDYNRETKSIAVTLKLETGIDDNEEDSPYSMRIEIVGIFQVDEAHFSVEHVPDWARRNAPIILYPYIREHAHSLPVRCGFSPLVLPLLEVPIFKLEKSRSDRI
jgi:preprotein translocase subunit SecB